MMGELHSCGFGGPDVKRDVVASAVAVWPLGVASGSCAADNKRAILAPETAAKGTDPLSGHAEPKCIADCGYAARLPQ